MWPDSATPTLEGTKTRPYLDRAKTVSNGIINGRERLVPGDRLLWHTAPEEGQQATVLFEPDNYCQVISRTWSPQFSGLGFPLLINNFTYEQPWPEMADSVQETLSLPIPRSWAPRYEADREDWVPIACDPPSPEYWLPQLRPRKR
jgi:hypothetical protein